MAISQTITDIPTPPSSSDAANFRTRADAFMASLDNLAIELNTFGTQANALETNVNNKEASAVSASIIASGAANYQGDWAAGSYSLGQSVSKDGIRYISKINSNSDTPPSSNWQEIVTAYGKNYIINGGFDYWNYATSQTTSGYGSDDRWVNFNTGSTKTHSRVASTDTERAFFNSPYFSRTVVASVAGVSNNVGKAHKIENVTKLAGKKVTISFKGKVDTNKNIAIEIRQNFGTGGTPSTTVEAIGSQLIPLETVWNTKSVTITIPSIVGKTIGTDGVHTSFTQILFWFDAGSNFTNPASLGQQSGTFDIAEVKLEEGSVATPWTPYEGEFGGEIQACQRYYEKINIKRWYTTSSGGLYGAEVKFSTQKRVPPSIYFINQILGSYGSLTYEDLGTSSCAVYGTAGASLNSNSYSCTVVASSEL